MTLVELNECMNVYMTMWKTTIVGDRHRDSVVEMWKNRGFLDYDKDLLIKAFYEYEDNTEKNYIAPRVKQIMECYRFVKSRSEDKGYRRIETPEEVMANIFHNEMAKPREKRNYDLLERTKYCAGLFQDDELYKKHFGKTREEFERCS